MGPRFRGDERTVRSSPRNHDLLQKTECGWGYCDGYPLPDPTPPMIPSDPRFADPRFVQAFRALEEAVRCQQLGRLDEAERLYARVLKKCPDYFEALNHYGLLKYQQGKLHEALKLISKAVALNPRSIDSLNSLAIILFGLKREKEAFDAFDRALALDPGNVQTLYNRGNSLHELKRFEEALACYERSLTVQPNYLGSLYNRGLILLELKRFEEALESFDRSLVAQPAFAEAFNNRGLVLHELKRYEDALNSFDQALSMQPDFARAFYNRGHTLKELKRYEEALTSFERALAIKADYAEALFSCGRLLVELRQYDKALVFFDKAKSIKPDLNSLLGERLITKMMLCDWSDFDNESARLIAAIQAGGREVGPFAMLAILPSATDDLTCAQTYARNEFSTFVTPLWHGERYSHDRIRVAYVSADLREHAVSALMADLFERHDRSRFETFAIALSAYQPSAIGERLRGAFDRFIDVDRKSDCEVAAMLREMEIDIAVDLMGYTRGARTSIFAMRPAPIQACFLGYPGTSGTDFMDYFIGDRIVLPFDQQPYFTEKIVHLPDSFMPVDSRQTVAQEVPGRSDVGLPEGAFVFCSFNDGYKITAQIFDIWMRLLRDVEGSVLWLMHSNDTAVANLRREAEARGVAGDRLIFAPRMERSAHLARISLADLFLNTHPVNAGATAIDALSTGLPIVTVLGDVLVQRVTASVLHAAGLPELVTNNFEDYEALALNLARHPAMLAEIKAMLVRNRGQFPLFNTERFTRHIEAAYTTMWQIWQRGEAPRSFAVEPIEDSGQVKQS